MLGGRRCDAQGRSHQARDVGIRPAQRGQADPGRTLRARPQTRTDPLGQAQPGRTLSRDEAARPGPRAQPSTQEEMAFDSRGRRPRTISPATAVRYVACYLNLLPIPQGRGPSRADMRQPIVRVRESSAWAPQNPAASGGPICYLTVTWRLSVNLLSFSKSFNFVGLFGGQGVNRTLDTKIFSLYTAS
jgi:hypothetical protein